MVTGITFQRGSKLIIGCKLKFFWVHVKYSWFQGKIHAPGGDNSICTFPDDFPSLRAFFADIDATEGKASNSVFGIGNS